MASRVIAATFGGQTQLLDGIGDEVRAGNQQPAQRRTAERPAVQTVLGGEQQDRRAAAAGAQPMGVGTKTLLGQ